LAHFYRSCLWGHGALLGFDEISKMAASLPAMIYADSKMAAIALAKISGYNNPRGIQDSS